PPSSAYAIPNASSSADQPQGWVRYGAGMAVVLEALGIARRDLLVYVESDIPMGSGVSSSAALELAFGIAYAELGGVKIASDEMAKLAQKCENTFVGVNCGIMDQMASACGRENRAMFLDTRDLNIVYAPLPDGVDVVLLDTKKPRALTDSAYNERRTQCEDACRELGVAQLRDADIERLRERAPRMDPTVLRRARHVITENARATEFYSALTRGDLEAAGRLMRESHASLRDDYEVSCRELDLMADAANAAGAIGARMTGAGFGGCCVALVPSAQYDEFEARTLGTYGPASGREGTSLRLRAVDGASVRVRS
ncbi:galactokinase, partial [bacterium]